MSEQFKRTSGQNTTCFDFNSVKYEVTEQGGITPGGVQWGGRHFCVVASNNTCTCGVPMLEHLPCSHMITVCRLRALDYKVPPKMSYELTLQAMFNTYSPRFEPYLDPTQWPSYGGEEYVADKSLMITTRGRRSSKRLRNDMDKAFAEPSGKNLCSLCHIEGHKKTKCPKRDKWKDRKRRCTRKARGTVNAKVK